MVRYANNRDKKCASERGSFRVLRVLTQYLMRGLCHEQERLCVAWGERNVRQLRQVCLKIILNRQAGAFLVESVTS